MENGFRPKGDKKGSLAVIYSETPYTLKENNSNSNKALHEKLNSLVVA
jgi:hypothetical protein